MDFIEKAKTTQVGWHLRITIGRDRDYRFRYSMAFDPVKRTFEFADFYDDSSKINHDWDVQYYVFTGDNSRFIVDYQRLRRAMPQPDATFNLDAIFSLNTLVDAGCVLDILKITMGEEMGEKYMETFDSKELIHEYQKNVLTSDIIPSGKRGKPLVLVGFQDGIVSTKLRVRTIEFHGESKEVAIPYESIKQVYYLIPSIFKGTGKVPAYRTVAQENITFSKAFAAWKETGKLPRTLPLLKIKEGKYLAVVDKKVADDKRFEEFTRAIVEKIKNKKPRGGNSEKNTDAVA